MKLLLVDDNPLALSALELLLDSIGRACEVVGVERNGLDAIDKARALCPDIVLMDVHMPAYDGLEALRRLREEAPGVRVIMMSADRDEAAVAQAAQWGACGYVSKFDAHAVLVDCLDHVMRCPHRSSGACDCRTLVSRSMPAARGALECDDVCMAWRIYLRPASRLGGCETATDTPSGG